MVICIRSISGVTVKAWKVAIFLLFLLFGVEVMNPAKAQSASNEGSEFYALFPMHVPSEQNGILYFANYSIFITSKQNSQVRLTAGNFSSTVNVVANQVVEVPIPRNDAYLGNAGINFNKAIHVKVTDGQPKVVVYGHIFAGARSAASLILPVDALGQRYFSMNYDDSFNDRQPDAYNFIAITANESNTKFFLKRKGVVLQTVTLANVGDVFQYLVRDDPTGIEVVTDPLTSECKKIAVFSGSTNLFIGYPNCLPNSSDPLYQQNYSVESWGTMYGFIPFSDNRDFGAPGRLSGSIYRILAKEDNTQVKINGNVVATLNSGDFYPDAYQARPSNVAAIISADKPIAVAQYALSQSCAGGGSSDPDMVLLNPIEYSIKDITVYSSNKERINQQYLNILIKTTSASSFRINGSVPGGNFTAVPSSPEYSYLRINLNNYGTNNFTLSAEDGFNAIAYGFGDFESYSYSAGTNLASNQTLSAVRRDTREELRSACTREDYDFKVVLPAIATKLVWTFDPAEPSLTQDNPVAIPVQKNDKTYYEYYYPRTRSFDVAGPRNIKVVAHYQSSNTCYKTEQGIDFIFDVYDPPVARFNAADACVSDAVTFKDMSTTSNKAISSWYWDFGDGNTSRQQNPAHKYALSGVYTVKLWVGNGTGCNSDIYESTVTVSALPVAAFSVSELSCTSNTVSFIDESTSAAGSITQWHWDFGDSRSSVEQNPTHSFDKPGNYTIKLKVYNSEGCQSAEFSRIVDVFAPVLEAGPDKTIVKGGATMLNILAEGNKLRYKWSPSAGLDRDDVKTPRASPLVETLYTVTITSEEGCVISDNLRVTIVEDIIIPNTFTPNGDGINDVWNVKYLESVLDAKVNIFNRYGVTVFSSRGYPVPWDGSFNGETLMTGTYYYVITVPGRSKPYSGYVTIVR